MSTWSINVPTAQSRMSLVGMPRETKLFARTEPPLPGLPSVTSTLNCFVSAALRIKACTTRELPCTSTVLPSPTKALPVSAIRDLLVKDMPANFSPLISSSRLQCEKSTMSVCKLNARVTCSMNNSHPDPRERDVRPPRSSCRHLFKLAIALRSSSSSSIQVVASLRSMDSTSACIAATGTATSWESTRLVKASTTSLKDISSGNSAIETSAASSFASW